MQLFSRSCCRSYEKWILSSSLHFHSFRFDCREGRLVAGRYKMCGGTLRKRYWLAFVAKRRRDLRHDRTTAPCFHRGGIENVIQKIWSVPEDFGCETNTNYHRQVSGGRILPPGSGFLHSKQCTVHSWECLWRGACWKSLRGKQIDNSLKFHCCDFHPLNLQHFLSWKQIKACVDAERALQNKAFHHFLTRGESLKSEFPHSVSSRGAVRFTAALYRCVI